MGIAARRVEDRGRVTHLLDNVAADLVGFLGHDQKALADRERLDHAVDQKRLRKQAEQREEPRRHPENEERRAGDEKVGAEQGFSRVEPRVLL